MTETLHFSIGAVDVSLRTGCRRFMDAYRDLYESYQCETAGENAINVELLAAGRFPWLRGPFTLRGEGIPDFEVQRGCEVLPHLEWFINWQIIHNLHSYVQLHASSLVRDGQAIILPGDSGSGKTTLTVGLLARQWSYLCDEFALIDSATCKIHPFPRALCIKEPSFEVVERLGVPLCRKTSYQKPTKGRVAFLNPLDIRPDAVGSPAPVRWVVFPRYVSGATPALQPISRAQAVFDLARQCFNFHAHQDAVMAVLAKLVREADCYRLIAGDIESTCDLVEALAEKNALRMAG